MKILEEPHQDPQRSLRRSLKILKDLKKIFTRGYPAPHTLSPDYYSVCASHHSLSIYQHLSVTFQSNSALKW